MNKTNDFKYNLPAYSDPVDIEDLNDNFRGIDDALMAGLCKKDYTGNNMGSSDPSARKYAWAPWLEIVNDNEFDVVVTDRNAPVGSEEATINIAAGQTFRKYINGRYYMNFYVQDQYDVTFKWFTNAETYINESGGGGGGTGTVTSVSVQGGSGSHLTGSGNPIETSGTITINVDEGYSIPSDNEQTAWDGKAADLKFEINSSTYVITAQLKDSSGNLIGNERTIDLPLESVVVSGTYDDQTKKVILTLQNGSTIEFSVADLVSGLQTELSASNKLDPDYIDYDSTHRAVTDTEKDTWNGKQNALTFDDTPTQNSNNPVKSGGIYTALAGKQASLDSTQLAAVNSGIDSSKVGQISTNQTNILSVQDMVTANWTRSRNLFDYDGQGICTIYSGTGVTATKNYDGTLTINGTVSGTLIILLSEVDLSDLFANGLVISGCPGVGSLMLQQFASPYTNYAVDTGSGATISGKTAISRLLYYADSGTVLNNVVVKPMLCSAEDWAKTKEFQPYALPNYDLTRLEAEDRTSLAEVVDSGAKNLVDWRNTVSFQNVTIDNGTYTTSGDSLTVLRFQVAAIDSNGGQIMAFNGNGTVPTANGVINIPFTIPTGTAKIRAGHNGSAYNGRFDIPLSGTTLEVGKSYVLQVNVTQYTNSSGIFKWKDLMVATKAAFGVSKAFQPYRPPYDQMFPKKCSDDNITDALAANYADGIVVGWASSIAGYTERWCIVRTYYLHPTMDRRIQIVEAYTTSGWQKMRYYNGTSWSEWT